MFKPGAVLRGSTLRDSRLMCLRFMLASDLDSDNNEVVQLTFLRSKLSAEAELALHSN
jgi:hypothetical protein